MTITTLAARASQLSAVGTENNPFVTGAPFEGTYSTGIGTEVQSASNAYTGTTFDQWTATPATGSASWEVDFGSAVAPTFFAMAAHNAQSVGASVRIEHSSDGSIWSMLHSETPTDNQAIGWRLSGNTSARYWRLRFTDLTGDISVGVIWIGTEIILPQRFYQGYRPPLTPTAVDLTTNVSEGAELLGTAYVERGSSFQANVMHLDPTFLRGANWLAFQRRWNRGGGSFWAWRPTKYGDLFYAWRDQGSAPIAPTNEGPKDLMALNIAGRLYHD